MAAKKWQYKYRLQGKWSIETPVQIRKSGTKEITERTGKQANIKVLVCLSLELDNVLGNQEEGIQELMKGGKSCCFHAIGVDGERHICEFGIIPLSVSNFFSDLTLYWNTI